MKTTIQGKLVTNEVPNQFYCNTLVGVWQLQFDPSLLPQLQFHLNQNVVIEGEQVGEPGPTYGGVFRIDSISVVKH